MITMNKFTMNSVAESVNLMAELNKAQLSVIFSMKNLLNSDVALFRAQFGKNLELEKAVLNIRPENILTAMEGNNVNIISAINIDMITALGKENMNVSEFELLCEKAGK